jgi:hypothetical protein
MTKPVPTIVVAMLVAMVGTPVMAEDGAKLSVGRAECRALVKHVADKGVAYQPGVDVRGKKVAPADVGGGSSWKVPDSITIDIGIDIAEKYGIGAGGKFTGEAVIAKVTVDTRTGAVLLDGKPAGDAEQTSIARACREAYGD